MPSQGQRLTRQQDFARVNKDGKSFFSPYFRIRWLPNRTSQTRYAVTVGIKTSKKATIRNRLRRRIGEALRINKGKLKPGLDLVISVKASALECSSAELREALSVGLKKANLLK